jgi:hypothetical protein
MVRRSSRTVLTYSELFSIASVVNLPKLYCVWMVMLHLEEYPKPYLYQVFMVIELNISTLDKTWQWLNEYFPGYTFITS